jgi:hypothetical protein
MSHGAGPEVQSMQHTWKKLKLEQNMSGKTWREKSLGRSRRTQESYIKADLKVKGCRFILLGMGSIFL